MVHNGLLSSIRNFEVVARDKPGNKRRGLKDPIQDGPMEENHMFMSF